MVLVSAKAASGKQELTASETGALLIDFVFHPTTIPPLHLFY